MTKKKTILDPIQCPVCEKEFIPKTRRVRTCSRSCGGKLGNTKEAREKAKQTKLERYGDPNYNNREKMRKTVQEKYGEQYINTSQVPHIKEKIVKTYTERHGGMGMASESVSEKVTNSAKKNLGIEDASITNVGQISAVKDKIRKTHDERWGGIGFASEELAQRSMSTYKELYGEELYESEYRFSLITKSFIEKYGVTSPALVPEFKDRLINNYIKNNGGMGNARDSVKVEHKKRMKMFEELYNLGTYSLTEIAGMMDVTVGTVRIWAKELGIKLPPSNLLNESWHNLIKKETGLHFNFEGKIYGDNLKRVDLYHDELKIGIEINPTITHTTQPSVFHGKKVPVKYHQERAIMAEKNGWHLIQVFDWDKEDDIINLIKSLANIEQKTIYARKCKVKELSIKEAKKFTNENHRQGSKARDNIAYGLFYKDELIQVMTFSKERFIKSEKGNYELVRLCSKNGVKVTGGASKLLKAFINSDYHPIRIKTFVDYAKGQGKVYEKMGMKYVGLANLNGYYANIDTGEAYKVTSVTSKFKKEYDRLGQTQQEYMNSKRFYRINDAGNKIFEWTRSIQK